MASKQFNCTKDASAIKATSGSFEGWSGTDLHHPCGRFLSNNFTGRSFVYFPVNFTGMDAISSATLYLTGSSAGSQHTDILGGSTTLLVRRMTSDWGEGPAKEEGIWGSANWNWSNRANAFTTSGSASRSFSNVNNGTEYSIDVTAIVQAWYAGANNYGFILMNSNETNNERGLEFYSRESGAGVRARLVIEYIENSPPNAPIQLSPSGNQLVNSLTPALSGQFSDPDSGDALTAVQILVADDNQSQIWDSGTLSASGQSFSKIYAGPPMSGNSYYQWMARTRDSQQEWGPFSDYQRFKVNSPPLAPSVSLVQVPINDIKTLTPNIRITHNDPDIGDDLMYGYRYIVETQAGVGVYDSGNVSTTESPISQVTILYAGPALEWATGYRVRARTRDSNLEWGPYSDNLLFSTHRTGTPINLSASATIVSGEGGGDDTIVFSATRASTDDTIQSYQIILYEPNSQVDIKYDSGSLTSGITGGAQVSHTFTGDLEFATQYQWRIRFNVNAGNTGGTSLYTEYQTIQTSQDATVPTQEAPIGIQAEGTGTLTPTFEGGRSTTFDRVQIVIYEIDGTTIVHDTGEMSQSSGNTYSYLYDGPALSWATTYLWKVRVGIGTVDESTYTSMSSFTTESAGAPILTSPYYDPEDISKYWINDPTPTFTGISSDNEEMDAILYQIYNESGVTLIYDSDWVDITDDESFSVTYSDTPLLPGVYRWQAKYRKTGSGIEGPFSTQATFRLNSPPSVPQDLFPSPGHVFRDTVLPTFRATFVDADRIPVGDSPTSWIIEVRNNDSNDLVDTIAVTSNLSSTENVYQWTGGDATLSYGQDYKWRTMFVDAKGSSGAWSTYRVFRCGNSPDGTILTPSNESSVQTRTPQITWQFEGASGKTQSSYRIDIVRRRVIGATNYENISLTPIVGIGQQTSHTIAPGILRNNYEYGITLTVTDSEGLSDPSPHSVIFNVNQDIPNAVVDLSATVEADMSRIVLSWTAPSPKSGQTFQEYAVYRKHIDEGEWYLIGTVRPLSVTTFTDYYSGIDVPYHYRVTQIAALSDGSDLESADSDIPVASLESNEWMIVGNDRAPEHIFKLPVVDDGSYTIPVQQEQFEPLGSNRKMVVRGRVLGYEGSIYVTYRDEPVYDDTGEPVNFQIGVDPNRRVVSEPDWGRRHLDYLLNNAGPHILKDPFGNVLDVEFSSQNRQYLQGGKLRAELPFVEVRDVSVPVVS